MKRISFLRLALFALIIIIVPACNDDDDNGPSNRTSINGESSVTLTNGEIQKDGPNQNGSYNWDVALYSDGISYDASTDEYSGQGDFLYLDLNTDNPRGLSDGDYNPSTTRSPFTFSVAGFAKNASIQTNQNDYATNLTSGTVTISGSSDNDNQVTIEYNLQNATSDTTVAGTYVGVLTKVD